MSKYISQGATWEEVINQAAPYANIAKAALDDPALGEVICLITRYSKIDQGKSPGGACKKSVITPANAQKGLGLSSALPAVRGFVWVKEHSLISATVAIAAVWSIWFLGYSSGRKRT